MKKSLIVLLILIFVVPSLLAGDETMQRFHSSGKASRSSYRTYNKFSHYDYNNYSTDFSSGNDRLIITHDGRGRDVIVISNKDELFINGKTIEVTTRQKETLRKFFKLHREIADQSTEMGLIGAEIGRQGAAIGLAASAQALSALGNLGDYFDYKYDYDYDYDDGDIIVIDDLDELDSESLALERYERALERAEAKAEKAARKAEKQAARAEARAEVLERKAERQAAKMEAKSKILEEYGDHLEDLTDELEDLQDELRHSIPALGALDWF
jgi:hypothetical protein